MVNDSFTGSHSTQQFDRTSVGFVDDYLARGCSSYGSYIFQFDVSWVCLIEEKIEEVIQKLIYQQRSITIDVVKKSLSSRAAI